MEGKWLEGEQKRGVQRNRVWGTAREPDAVGGRGNGEGTEGVKCGENGGRENWNQ